MGLPPENFWIQVSFLEWNSDLYGPLFSSPGLPAPSPRCSVPHILAHPVVEEEETNETVSIFTLSLMGSVCFPGFSASMGFLLQGPPLEIVSQQAFFRVVSEPTVICLLRGIHSWTLW